MAPAWVAKPIREKSCKTSLLDHLVSEREHVVRYREIHRLCRFHVDDKEVARWDLDRQIGWLCALENPSSQICGAVEGFARVSAVGHQAAIPRHKVLFVDGGAVCSRAKSNTRLRLRSVSESVTIRMASGNSRFMAAKASLKSFGSRTPSGCTVTPSSWAAFADAS